MRRLGVAPDLKFGAIGVQLVTTRGAVRLTGLSTEQLREWTIRRALIPADIRSKGHGSPARYSWQTILLLRFALIFRNRFKLELHAHRTLFIDLGHNLAQTPFRSLWGKLLAVKDDHHWSFLQPEELSNTTEDCIVLRLNPHLEILAEAFSLAHPAQSEQYQLFPGTRTGLHVVTRVGGALK
jgi:hypothetical protein